MFFFVIRVPFEGHGVENINAVKMKSMTSTDSDDTTTVRVVAYATPEGVARVS
jgi:hypothetical protein